LLKFELGDGLEVVIYNTA